MVPHVSRRWEAIGIGLGIGDYAEGEEFLDSLSGEDPDACCMKVFKFWLRQNKPATTWAHLLRVLEDQGMNDAVQKVKGRYEGTCVCVCGDY